MNRFSRWNHGALLALGLIAAAAPVALARQDVNRPPAHKSTPARVHDGTVQCLVSSSKAELDINNVRAMVLNGGDMWWNLNDARYEVPKVVDPNAPKRYSIFAGAVWIGGKDPGNNLLVAAQTYRQGNPADAGYWPGPLREPDAVVTEQVCNDWNSHAKINRSVIDQYITDYANGVITTESQIPQAIREWPGTGNPYLNREGIDISNLAPYVDADQTGTYTPLGGDYPDIKGDQAIWWVMNDVGGVKEPLSASIGLELSIQAFAFQTNDVLNNMTFYKQRVANKGQLTLTETYLGQWVDPDLGYFNDDYVGCDVTRGLGLCYNGDNFDEGVSGYGNNPPTVAVDFFDGPLADRNDHIDNDRDSYSTGTLDSSKVDELGEKIIMSNFVYYNNDFSVNGNPTAKEHFYYYLQSKIKDGRDLKFGGDGLSNTVGTEKYAFMFQGGAGYQSDPLGWGYGNKYTDPLTKNPLTGKTPPFSWSESNPNPQASLSPNVPADRRFLESAGPFTLRPGAVNNLTIGVIWGSAGSGGPQGSNALVIYSDDQAQAAFNRDFDLPVGPPAPIVAATELDQQIVLSIQPRTTTDRQGHTYNTETYFFEDKGLENARDKTYRFEGYLVYQLANPSVSAADINNKDKARLVARGDVVNGVGKIINYEFDADVNQVVPVVKVTDTNADQGIFHTLNITSDLFASGNSRLVNFKTYYYLVIPYAYNADNTQLADGSRAVPKRYLEGRSEVTPVMPHKPLPEKNGTILNASVGDQLPIKRVFGTGTGGKVLEISEQDEQDIVRDHGKQILTYDAGHSPISVKVYDPKRVANGKFTVKLSSRLVYNTRSHQGRQYLPGDSVLSTGQYATSETAPSPLPAPNSGPFNSGKILTSLGPQIPGKGVVQRIVSRVPFTTAAGPDTLVTLDIQMVNDHLGGTFMAAIETYLNSNVIDPSTNNLKDPVFTGYGAESRPFVRIGDPASLDTARDYTLHDFWYLRNDNTNEVRFADRTVSEFNEQLIPEYGLAIQIQRGFTPGTAPRLNRKLQFQEASLTFTADEWLTGVPYEKETVPIQGNPSKSTTIFGTPWLSGALSKDNPKVLDFDPAAAYNNVLQLASLGELNTLLGIGGTYAPYASTLPVDAPSTYTQEAGAAYPRAQSRTVYNLRNVDIVYTPDKSKWTRVPVLQLSLPTNTTVDNDKLYRVTKRWSLTPSINEDGNPTGDRSPFKADSISRGMGWFPGYAIDLDRGIRLNMMFAEDQDVDTLTSATDTNLGQGPIKGRDLKWEPNSNKNGGRNFIYVLTTQYDQGNKMERAQDSLRMTTSKPQFAAGIKKLYDDIMWVGNPRLADGKTMFQGNSIARVRLRVDRYFTSYPGPVNGLNTNPEYSFEAQGQAVVTNQRDKACEGLSLVRVVPNPYYAFSQYEQRQLDNIVKVTNLPRRCDITIYTMNGTLVRRIHKDDDRTYSDFNMKNETGLPIASGVYIFHVNAPDLGCETVLKWFGVLRPIDLDTF